MIESLPLLTPNAQRGARTIARCHQRMGRRRKQLESAVTRTNATYLALERALILGFCVLYMSDVALLAIQMLSGG